MKTIPLPAFKTVFLPLLLVAAVLHGRFFPAPGTWMDQQVLLGMPIQHWLITVLFFLYGYKLRKSDLRLGRRFGSALAAAILISLVLGPLAGLAAAWTLRVPESVFIGLLAMACVPPTLTSAIVLTENARGDTLWALMLTIFLTFAGILILPFSLSWTLNLGVHIPLSVWPFMVKIFRMVLIPILLGKGLSLLLRGRTHPFVDYVPSICVALVAWMPVSANAATLGALSAGGLGTLVLCALLAHGALLLAAWGTRPVLQLTKAETTALAFVSAQKTLPLALTALAALPRSHVTADLLAMATVTCVVFHFSQILLDSAIAGWLVRGRT